MNHPDPITKCYKQLFWALIYSPIIAYLINAYLTYSAYKKHDSNYTVSLEFFSSTAKYMLDDITITLMFLWIPYVWIVIIPYLFIFYKALTSKRAVAEKYRTLLLTFLLVLLFIFAREYSDLIALST